MRTAAIAERTSSRAPLVPDEVEIIPDERVEILDAKADEPKFGANAASQARST